MSVVLAITLAALELLCRRPACDIETERPRIEAFADGIAGGVEDADDANPFRGSGRKQAAALLLVSIARHESALRADVSDCRLTGDRSPWHGPTDGPSVTAFQLRGPWARGRYSRAEVCASPRIAAAQALRVFGLHAKHCKRGTPLDWVNGYSSGSCGRPTKAGRIRCDTWQRLAAQHGLVGASCHVQREISVAPLSSVPPEPLP